MSRDLLLLARDGFEYDRQVLSSTSVTGASDAKVCHMTVSEQVF
jgi:hypothetical protein